METSGACEGEHPPTRLLVVEDDLEYREILIDALRARVPDLAIEAAGSLESAHERVRDRAIDAMLLDLSLPDGDALDFVRQMRRCGSDVPFLLLTADATAVSAVRALRAGASDYEVKSVRAFDRIARSLRALVERREASRGPLRGQLVGTSAAIAAVRAEVARCARSRACVRIEGETGVGKELVARSIHEASARARGPFVAVNCGALPESLAEAELFGHVRGAYTGASADRAGLVAHARGGTLLLDEIEDLPASIQGKLLRLVQEGEYRPIGTPRVHTADVRLLAASNRDLETMVEEGGFRRDLFYRLDVLRVSVPPLRERVGDLGLLIAHVLARGADGRAVGADAAPLPAELDELRGYDWPGNVRELENVVERASALAEIVGWRVGWASALSQLVARSACTPPLPAAVAEASPEKSERGEIERLLARHRWRREAVARELGISRVTLWRRMKRLGMIRIVS